MNLDKYLQINSDHRTDVMKNNKSDATPDSLYNSSFNMYELNTGN